MSTLSLPTNLIDKVHAQIDNWQNKTAISEFTKTEEAHLPFITISRQFGCQAFVLAELLAAKLNVSNPNNEFLVYDRKLLHMISQSEAAYENLIKSLTTRKKTELEDWVIGLFSGTPSEMKIYHKLSETICAIASNGYAIIIGRGSAMITRYLSGGINIRITAPADWRLKTLQNNPNFTEEINHDILRHLDLERESFVKKYLGTDISDSEHFHLTFNNKLMTPDEMADIVEHFIKLRYQGF